AHERHGLRHDRAARDAGGDGARAARRRPRRRRHRARCRRGPAASRRAGRGAAGAARRLARDARRAAHGRLSAALPRSCLAGRRRLRLRLPRRLPRRGRARAFALTRGNDTVALTNVYPSLTGKVVFVTGGATGIGATLVQAFCRQHAVVAFVDILEHEGQALVATLAADATATTPHFFACDLRDVEALRSVISSVKSTLGPIEVL